MRKERSFISLLLSIPLLIVFCYLRPRSVGVTVVPFTGDPVYKSGPAGERFWVLKAQGKAKNDMILMGDSRVYRGLSPQAMEAVLPGFRILNYGFSGGGLNPVMYEAAEGRLNPASRQRVIVFGVTPLTLTPRAARNEHYLQELSRSPDYLFLHEYGLPLLNFLEPIRLGESALARPAAERQPVQEGYYQEFHDDGWVASWTVPEYPDSNLYSYRQIFSQTAVSPNLVQQLLNQTRRWREEGVWVFAFRVPSSQAMVELENQMSSFNEQSFAQQFETAGGVWFDIPLTYYSYDGSHLIKAAAVQFSTDLAQLIKSRIEGK